MAIDPNDPYAKDTRPSLAKALGDRGIVVKIVDVFDGTGHALDGIPLALRALSADVRAKASGAALRFLTGPCSMSEEYLYGTPDGAQERNLETMIQLLAVALCEPAPPHAPVVGSADELRGLIDAPTAQQLFGLYGDWLAERNPLGQAKSLADVEEVLTQLGKGMTPPSRLHAFDSSTLRSALHSLACQREKLTSSNSSPSSPSTGAPETP